MSIEENIPEKEIQNESISQENINQKEEINDNVDFQIQLDEEKNKFLRLYAEFENYKKRSYKEKIDVIKYGNREVLSAFLPIVDDFERAIKEIEKYNQKSQDIIQGVQLIQDKFLNILQEKGLFKMQIQIGDDFNSDKHEAITQIPAPNEELKNKIVDIIETGYTLNDKIIRFAKVVVGS